MNTSASPRIWWLVIWNIILMIFKSEYLIKVLGFVYYNGHTFNQLPIQKVVHMIWTCSWHNSQNNPAKWEYRKTKLWSISLLLGIKYYNISSATSWPHTYTFWKLSFCINRFIWMSPLGSWGSAWRVIPVMHLLAIIK